MKKLFVMYGGVGSEKEVSILSGTNVVETLRSEGVVCEEIFVDEKKQFVYKERVMSEGDGLKFLKEQNALVFQVIHGTYGEDGELAKKFEGESVAYIGSRSNVLTMTINKYLTEVILREHGIYTTESLLVKKLEDVTNAKKLMFPCIVKPNSEGSSIGVVKVNDYATLKVVVAKQLEIYSQLLVQKCLSGREFTCGVMEIDGKVVALTPTEVIVGRETLFDYDAKYSEGGAREVTPPDIGGEMIHKIQEVALSAHYACGCKDISRTDMVMDEEEKFIVLEINTVPGMTKRSFIPAEMKASGYTLSQFVKGMMGKYE